MSSSVIEVFDLEEDSSDTRLESVRRCLDNVAFTIKEIIGDKDQIYGSLKFDANKISEEADNLEGKGVSHTLNYLVENTDYVRNARSGYRIDLDKVEELLEIAENLDTIKTRKEEEILITEIVEEYDGMPTTSEIKEELKERIDYFDKISEHIIYGRIRNHPRLVSEDLYPDRNNSEKAYKIKSN